MNYIRFAKFLPTLQPKMIFEVGSHHCRDALALHREFACPVYAFECNPEALKICRQTLAQAAAPPVPAESRKPNPEPRTPNPEIPSSPVTLIEKALSDRDGTIDFFAVDKTRWQNIAASSMFEIDFKTNRDPRDPDYGLGEVQNRIEVPSVRGDTFCREHGIDRVDLICIDAQGAELLVLKGFGEKLKGTSAIITETCLRTTYRGGPNFWELGLFLQRFGFRYLVSDAFGQKMPDVNEPTMPGFSEFNCVFVRAP